MCLIVIPYTSSQSSVHPFSCYLKRFLNITKHVILLSFYRDYTGSAVSLLVGNGAGVNNNLNEALSTPLHLAVTQHNEAAVQSLVVCDGCDVNVQVYNFVCNEVRQLFSPLSYFKVAT